MNSGIYLIRCEPTGKLYVGQSTNIKKRKAVHYSELRGGYHKNTHLQRAYNKHGESAFRFCILECAKIKDLDSLETYWIRFFRSDDGVHGFNMESGGNLNKTASKETKEKISAVQIGRKQRKESVEKRRISNTGKKRSKEFCIRNGDLHRGKNVSAETRAKISAAKLGSTHSEETKKKMSTAHIGLIRSSQHCKNLSISLTGKTVSDETKKRMSASRVGFVPSKETREKISNAVRAAWAARKYTAAS